MNDKINKRHTERLAFVYVRQSSPRQVRVNLESQKQQEQMKNCAIALGWTPSRVIVVGGDTGKSASTQHGREEYQSIVKAVMLQEAGIIFARELSRLVRDNQDWTQLVRICRINNVLLGDEHRIYDSNDPQDRVLLGIHGAFNEYELSVLNARMLECRARKAERGELKMNVPAGYICRQEGKIDKHPDPKVQRSIEYIFELFEQSSSVRQLFIKLREQNFRFPSCSRQDDWRQVTWVDMEYDRLLNMLKNPTYMGSYVWGRNRTESQLDEQGHVVKKQKPVSSDDWRICLDDHHPAYITREMWSRNQEKISANANMKGRLVKGSAKSGQSLVAGLLRCRRCGNKLYVRYFSNSADAGYLCLRGSVARHAKENRCLYFRGRRIEPRFEGELLYVVSPAGVEASLQAAGRLIEQHARRRQLLQDQVKCAEQKAHAAEREYRQTDPSFQEIRRTLGAEWEKLLVELQEHTARLHLFDRQEPSAPTPQQKQMLETLGRRLEEVWHHPGAANAIKKQIVRILVEEIVVDVDEASDEIIWIIHWKGGYHSELRAPYKIRKGSVKADELKMLMCGLLKVIDERTISATLNRHVIQAPEGGAWTPNLVKDFCKCHKIPGFNAARKEEQGWLTQAEAANSLEISPMSVTRLIKQGILPAERAFAGLPAVVKKSDLDKSEVKLATLQVKNAAHRPLPANSDQLSLF